MRRLITILLFLLINFGSNAQGIDNYWPFGYGIGNALPFGPGAMDFLNGSPTIYFDSLRNMNFDFTAATISDSLGNVLFYTNGIDIANRTGQTMVNGAGLNPSTYTTQQQQLNTGLRITAASTILPYPGHQNQYMLIHETGDDLDYPYPSYLYYSIIDMALDSGRGAVILKNQIIISDTLDGGQIVVCKHANGRDWWIVAPEKNINGYYVLLLSPTGILLNSHQYIGTRTVSSGQAAFSPDGSTYASYDTYADLEVYDFDRCSGVFSNPRHVAINDSVSGFGVSFSPDGKNIYASSVLYLYQFDLNNLNISNYDTVAVWDSTYSPSPPFATYFFTQALRPDGKIYITTGNGTDRMHTIDYPDSSGLACHVSQHSVILPTYNSSTCPTFPNYYLGPVVGSVCDSLTGINENVSLTLRDIRIYPNPASTSFWLNYFLPDNKDGWLRIFNSQGKLMQQKRLYWSTTQLQFYTDHLTNGLYFLEVQSDLGIKTSGKVLILK